MTSNELQAFYARDLAAALRAGDPRRLSPRRARLRSCRAVEMAVDVHGPGLDRLKRFVGQQQRWVRLADTVG